MLHGEALGLLVGAVTLGAIHGVEPGHGWPVAATYALDQANTWIYGLAASVILGVGHLISSIAMVLAFFYAKSYFDLTRINEPIHLVGNVFLGGPVSVVAGLLLIVLGIREYRHGHGDDGPDGRRAHAHESGHPHDSADVHDHPPHQEPVHTHEGGSEQSPAHHGNGSWGRLKGYFPFVGGHSHSHEPLDEAANRGLLGIAWFAFLLGFAHEEEFEIIALCAGSVYCLELMLAYAVTVIIGIVGLTLLLIAGYEHYEEKVDRYTPYLPAFSAFVLIAMGSGFILGVF